MNPYYSNWNYGYTLAPATDQSRGAYNVYSEAAVQPQTTSGNSGKQKFVSSSVDLNTDSATSSQPIIGPVKPELQQPSKDDNPNTAIQRVHELAVSNRLVERYDKVSEPTPGEVNGKFTIKLFIGAEVYEGSGENTRTAKQAAALMCLTNTKYQTAKEKKMSMFKTANRIGITATSELHELAAKKNIVVEFKFLEPYNFEYKPSMRIWTKKDMLGNYRVQLNMAGYEFYGQAELPQQAKHNAATQALDILRKLPANHGEGKVIAKPGMTPDELEKEEEESAPVQTGGKNVIMLLNEVATSNNITPSWELVSESGPAHAKTYTWELKMGEFVTIGSGPNKKTGKQGAADQMWATLPEDWKKKAKKQLGKHGFYSGRGQRFGKRGPVGPMFGSPPEKKKASDGNMMIAANNPISCLYEYAKKKKVADPIFNVVNETVIGTGNFQNKNIPFKKVEYTVECDIEGRKFKAVGMNKKAAKTTVAMEAWDVIKRENNL